MKRQNGLHAERDIDKSIVKALASHAQKKRMMEAWACERKLKHSQNVRGICSVAALVALGIGISRFMIPAPAVEPQLLEVSPWEETPPTGVISYSKIENMIDNGQYVEACSCLFYVDSIEAESGEFSPDTTFLPLMRRLIEESSKSRP